MDNKDVQKEIGLFLANAHLDTAVFENDKDRLAYAKTISELYKTHLDDRKLDLELEKFNFEKELETKKLALETEKLEIEDHKVFIQENQAKNEVQRIKAEKAAKITDTVVRVFCTIAEVSVPACVYLICYDKGMEFEKEGIVTSGFFKNMLHLIKPTKK